MCALRWTRHQQLLREATKRVGVAMMTGSRSRRPHGMEWLVLLLRRTVVILSYSIMLFILYRVLVGSGGG